MVSGFKSEGLNVDTQTFTTGSTALAALSGGSVDIAAVGGLNLFQAAAQGDDVVGIFAPISSSPSAIVALSKFKSTYGTDISKFANARWGYAGEGTSTAAYMQTVAQANGLNWSKVNHAALGSDPAIFAALQAGQVDIAATNVTEAAAAIANGSAYLVLNTSDPTQTAKYWGPQLGSAFVTTKEFIKKNPQAVQKFVDALSSGMKFVQDNSGNPQAVLAKFPANLQSSYKASWDGLWAIQKQSFTGDGSITAALVTGTTTWAKKYGLFPSDAKLPASSVYIDNSFVTEAKSGT